MTDMTKAPGASASRSPAALVGGALLVAALGVGAGWLMRGPSATAPTAAAVPPAATATAQTPAPADAVMPPQPATPALSAQTAPERPADEVDNRPPPVRSHPAPVPTPAPRPVHRSVAHAPAAPAPAPMAQAPVVQSAPVCHSCGVVESVQAERQQAPAQGIGAVAGGVLGGVLGNQVGGGTGRAAMTVLGAVGGGLAGNEVEKRVRSTTVYAVRVRMDDGSVRSFTQQQPIATGTRVVEQGGAWHVQ